MREPLDGIAAIFSDLRWKTAQSWITVACRRGTVIIRLESKWKQIYAQFYFQLQISFYYYSRLLLRTTCLCCTVKTPEAAASGSLVSHDPNNQKMCEHMIACSTCQIGVCVKYVTHWQEMVPLPRYYCIQLGHYRATSVHARNTLVYLKIMYE